MSEEQLGETWIAEPAPLSLEEAAAQVYRFKPKPLTGASSTTEKLAKGETATEEPALSKPPVWVLRILGVGIAAMISCLVVAQQKCTGKGAHTDKKKQKRQKKMNRGPTSGFGMP